MNLVPLGSCDADYDTLGVDSNGIYICATGGTVVGCYATVKLAALPKGPFLDGSAQQVQSNFVLDVDTGAGSPATQPAVNFDPVTTDDPAWFIFELDGLLSYNRLKWVNGFTSRPQWQDPTPWPELTISGSYSGLGGINAPQLNGADGVALSHQGTKLMMAMVRKIVSTQYL